MEDAGWMDDGIWCEVVGRLVGVNRHDVCECVREGAELTVLFCVQGGELWRWECLYSHHTSTYTYICIYRFCTYSSLAVVGIRKTYLSTSYLGR